MRAAKARAPQWSVWLATGFGSGLLPLMPGTFGSAVGVLFYALLIHFVNAPVSAVIIALVCAASLPIIGKSLPYFAPEQDPQRVVLDEIAGQMLTLMPIAFFHVTAGLLWHLVAGFILFRFLDMLKPYPIRRLGDFAGALGVLADDLGAGAVGALVLAIVIRLRLLG